MITFQCQHSTALAARRANKCGEGVAAFDDNDLVLVGTHGAPLQLEGRRRAIRRLQRRDINFLEGNPADRVNRSIDHLHGHQQEGSSSRQNVHILALARLGTSGWVLYLYSCGSIWAAGGDSSVRTLVPRGQPGLLVVRRVEHL